jgi:hypothetical protein
MWERKDEYIEQLMFVNKKVMEVVDSILISSEHDPIIIVQSDHGPQISQGITDEFIEARMSILNAYYLPKGGNSLLYPTITPVNTFRVIFDFYFESDFSLLPDECYFSRFSKPYRFSDYRCSTVN